MNVLLFTPKSGKKDHSLEKFQDLTKTCSGKIKLLKGDLIIKSYLKMR